MGADAEQIPSPAEGSDLSARPAARHISRVDDEEPAAPDGSTIVALAGGLAPAHCGEGAEIKIAGRSFASRNDVVAHVKAMQAAAPDGAGFFGFESAFFLLHLALHHPLFAEKVKSPLLGFRYGECPGFRGTKSFLSVHADGSVSGISWQKSLDVMCPKKAAKRPRDEPEPASPKKAVKRPRDEPAPARQVLQRTRQHTERQVQQRPEHSQGGGQEEPCATRVSGAAGKNEEQRGTVLEVRGLPEQTEYGAVRTFLEERFGKVQFAEVLNIPSSARSAVPEEWRGDELAGMVTATARVRFETVEAAARAAAELKVFGTSSVQASVLVGDAEESHWRRLRKALRRKRGGVCEAPDAGGGGRCDRG